MKVFDPSFHSPLQVKSMRSSFGKQADSRMKSTGGFSFGSSTRDTANRQYVSPAVDRAQLRSRGGNQSPGAGAYNPLSESTFAKSQIFKGTGSVVFGTSKRLPDQRPRSPGPGAYESIAAVGNQTLSNRPTSAMASFGRTDRDAASRVFLSSRHEKANIGKHSPGPGVYETPMTLGAQKSAVFSGSSPSAVMGRSEKFAMTNYEMRKRAASPGAGAYNIDESIGRQAMSTRRSMSSYSFGGATREQAGSIFISSKHEKSQYSKHAPGVGAYETGSGFNRQSLSKSMNAPSVAFGKSAKLGMKKSDVPGPGSYYAW